MPGFTPTIQMSVPMSVSSWEAGAGGERRPYWRVDENVSQMRWFISSRSSMNGAHLGNELVSAVLPLSATPGLLAATSARGARPDSDVRKIVAVASALVLESAAQAKLTVLEA